LLFKKIYINPIPAGVLENQDMLGGGQFDRNRVKETECVISSELPFKEGDPRFKTVPFKPLNRGLIKYVQHIRINLQKRFGNRF